MRIGAYALCTVPITQPAFAAAQPQPAQAAPAPRYSIKSTQLGTLLANPDTRTILEKHAPDLVRNSDQYGRAEAMSLKEMQEALGAYAPDLLTDKVLAAIEQEFARLPAKN